MNNGRFIYVFNKSARDILLKAGFTMINEENDSGAYVFLAGSGMDFALDKVSYIRSDSLTF